MFPSDGPRKNSSEPHSRGVSNSPEESQQARKPAQLILCERTGIWAPAMLRAEPKIRKYWKRFRSWPRAWEAFLARPESFLVVELQPDNLPEILSALRWIDLSGSKARLAVVAKRRWANLEWMVRQAGVVHFTSSPRQLGPLVQMALRHLRRQRRPAKTFEERIWRCLPWPKPAAQ